ncbi:MAG: hypothetical protein JJD97_10955 [Gemmatimonadaceae bacterium]|nr:hypothetical protein [Gemmatimonadaceae bacterium]
MITGSVVAKSPQRTWVLTTGPSAMLASDGAGSAVEMTATAAIAATA